MLAYFANPWGLLALLGLPAIVAIHFLQRRVKECAVSTLFLLEAAQLETRAGRRFERLLPSIPFWLQLCMVLLLAFVLSEPRMPWQAKTRRLAVVVDDSASMLVAKPSVLDTFAVMTRKIEGFGGRAEFLILPASPDAPRLYTGDRSSDALGSLEKMQFNAGPVDPTPALRLARERVGADGIVVWLTDTPVEKLPADAALVAVGKPVPNTGITGVTFSRKNGEPHWEALVVNRSQRAESRQWHLEWDAGSQSPPQSITLQPGEYQTITGPLPQGASRLELILTPDAFPLDDRFPFVKPQPRPLVFRNTLPEPLKWLPEMLQRGVPALDTALEGESPDIVLAGSSDGIFPPLGNAVLVNLADDPKAPMLDGVPVAARHPLNDGLVWDGLAAGGNSFLPAKPGDTPLLWVNGQSLISLREVTAAPADASQQPAATSSGKQLVLHFHPNRSNFSRLPAAAILLLRFCEELRSHKSATAWERVDPAQPLGALLPDGNSPLILEELNRDGGVRRSTTIEPAARGALHAPAHTGFFRIRSGNAGGKVDEILLEGAVAFADGREGDFAACATSSTFDSAHAIATRSDNRDEKWWKLAVISVLSLLLASWFFLGRQPSPGRPAEI